MLLNADNTSILIAGDCSLKEWKVDLTPSNILFRDWGDIHGNNQITCMSLSKPINDSKTGGGNNSKMSPSMANNMKFLFKLIQILFTGDHLGNVKVWNYETQECIKALDDIHCAELSFVKLTQDYKYVQTIDKSKKAKMNIFSVDDNLRPYDALDQYNKTKEEYIDAITIGVQNNSQKYLIFTSDTSGNINQWTLSDNGKILRFSLTMEPWKGIVDKSGFRVMSMQKI